MCKIICLGDGGTYGYIKFSVSYLFNARNVTFRTYFSVNGIVTEKAI